MTLPAPRYIAAALIALVLALYTAAFSRQTHDLIDLPTVIGLTEWPAVLAYLGAAWAAWSMRERLGAIVIVAAMFAFFAAHARFLAQVPLAFALITGASLCYLIVLPVTWNSR